MSDRDQLPENWEAIDSYRSFYEAVREIGERVRAGEPLPWFFRSMRDEGSDK